MDINRNKIMKDKTRMISYTTNNIGNSIYSLEAKYVTDVWDTENNKLKFDYNINEERLTILDGEVDTIYVLFENKK